MDKKANTIAIMNVNNNSDMVKTQKEPMGNKLITNDNY